MKSVVRTYRQHRSHCDLLVVAESARFCYGPCTRLLDERGLTVTQSTWGQIMCLERSWRHRKIRAYLMDWAQLYTLAAAADGR